MDLRLLNRPSFCTVKIQEENIMSDMIVTNLETVPGYTIVQHLGLVQGNTVRAKHVGRDIMAGLKNIVGGELRGYTELLNDARGEATARMVDEARGMGAKVFNQLYLRRRVRALRLRHGCRG